MRSIVGLALGSLVLAACGDDGGDGNRNNQNNQSLSVCGDGVVGPDEECDDGAANSDRDPDSCRSNCLTAYCGDGVVDSGETCDDGNRSSGDGCSDDCQSNERCGNGILDPQETCDDGTANADVADAACRTDCRPQRCGDRVLDAGEECDDGPNLSDILPGACRTDCRAAHCGDGVLDPAEGCDDGGTVAGDGCSADCRGEEYFSCVGQPSACTCETYFSGPGCARCTVHVRADATDLLPDGVSWATAYPRLQDGLRRAEELVAQHGWSTRCEVWVARGAYHPYEGTRRDSFVLPSRVGVLGGFAGHETDPDARDWRANVTVLGGRDPAVAGSQVLHVVTATSTHDATLDGFVLTRGSSGGAPEDANGSALYLDGAVVHVRRCLVYGNQTDESGAVFVYAAGPTFTDVHFVGNVANGGAGALTARFSTIVADRCWFQQNTGYLAGGGINGGAMNLEEGSSVHVSNSVFVANAAQGSVGYGGAAHVAANAYGEFTNVVMVRNQALRGGALSCAGTVDLTNATVVGNTATTSQGALYLTSANNRIKNSIFWATTPASQPIGGGGSLDVSYCDVQGAGSCDHCFDATPLFVAGPGQPSGTGTWTVVAYDAERFQTVLTVAGTPWVAGELDGALVRPKSTDARWLLVVSSTANEIRVWGEQAWVAAGDTYELYDLHLSYPTGTPSPCIDAGDDQAPKRLATDLEGHAWANVPGVRGEVVTTDLGAYEYVP